MSDAGSRDEAEANAELRAVARELLDAPMHKANDERCELIVASSLLDRARAALWVLENG